MLFCEFFLQILDWFFSDFLVKKQRSSNSITRYEVTTYTTQTNQRIMYIYRGNIQRKRETNAKQKESE